MNLFKKNCSNMSEVEINIRWVISIIFIILSFITPLWFLFIISISLIYQNLIKNCFLYSTFKINEDIRKRNKFLQALPKFNPEPILIIDRDSKILFKNEPAKNIFPENGKFEFLNNKELLERLIDNEEVEQVENKFNENKIYTFMLKGTKELNAIMVYGTDITEVVKTNEEIINIQKEIVYTMGTIGETRSNETGNHVKRVAEYSKLLALKYGLSEEESNLLKMASPMHDIGKVGIKDEILNKPGKLTPEEFDIMKTHALLGYELLKNSDKPILKAAAIVAHEHHEKWDGSGYPQSKKAEDIHIYGRITAVADVFDALGSKRIYKEAWPLEKIFELFKEQRGKHFDPKLIDIFFNNFKEFDKIRLKYID